MSSCLPAFTKGETKTTIIYYNIHKDEEEEKGENDISPTNDIVAKQT